MISVNEIRLNVYTSVELFLPNSFSSFFGTKPKINSFRLQTHSYNDHRNFFDDPILN